jgi:hypothetical protein
MKKIIFILLLLATYEVGLTQQKYDDGQQKVNIQN